MPKLSQSLPKYRAHKASGQARVTLNGQTFYLGPYGTKTSKLEYDRLVGEWLANGRMVPGDSVELVTITEICVRYFKHAQSYYRKNGKVTNEVAMIKLAIKPVRELYGKTDAVEFGPKRLKAIREKMVRDGTMSRKTINEQISRVRRMFKWCAAEELVSAEIYHQLSTVEGLKRGRTEAKEGPGVQSVELTIVEATLPHLLKIPADMVLVQLMTGARPQDVCNMRPCDIDQTGEVWQYRPSDHKTIHRDKERLIFIGPQCQTILRPYLNRLPVQHCFSPREAVEQKLREKRLTRQTPRYGNRKYKNKSDRVGDQYSTASYRRAIHRACDKAFPVPDEFKADPTAVKQWQSDKRWSPNQLRHTKGTQIRKEFGLEAAQVMLGHSHANTTEIYAEKNLERGIEIARKIG